MPEEKELSICRLRMELPPRENLPRKYNWDVEQYRMILRVAMGGYYEKKYGLKVIPDQNRSPSNRKPRLFPRPVKGISGKTVYYVLRVGNYTPILAFLYDTSDIAKESVEKNHRNLRIQCVFAEYAEMRPKDIEYNRNPEILSKNVLEWILQHTKIMAHFGVIQLGGEVRISDYFTKQNAKYHEGVWIEAYYDSNGLLVPYRE